MLISPSLCYSKEIWTTYTSTNHHTDPLIQWNHTSQAGQMRVNNVTERVRYKFKKDSGTCYFSDFFFFLNLHLLLLPPKASEHAATAPPKSKMSYFSLELTTHIRKQTSRPLGVLKSIHSISNSSAYLIY